jgi:hypothetical protein
MSSANLRSLRAIVGKKNITIPFTDPDGNDQSVVLTLSKLGHVRILTEVARHEGAAALLAKLIEGGNVDAAVFTQAGIVSVLLRELIDLGTYFVVQSIERQPHETASDIVDFVQVLDADIFADLLSGFISLNFDRGVGPLKLAAAKLGIKLPVAAPVVPTAPLNAPVSGTQSTTPHIDLAA